MEREAALVALRKTLVRMYSDADEDDVAALVRQLADALPSTQRIQALTADAGDVFPADFMNVKVKAVLKTFTELQKEKGLL
ncbi:hypothetical protein EON67_02960 [archaeon]|nr:MAG: hypothetical protein EON67_02960 [archaeon]